MEDKYVIRTLCWIFACTSLLYILISFRSMYTISRQNASLTLRNLLISVLFEIVVATSTGIAWWTTLKGRPAAKGWGIAASVMCILIFLRPIVLSLQTAWPHHMGALVIGIAGLITFSRRSFVSPEADPHA